MTKLFIKDRIANGEFIVAPGIQDMISAVIANQLEFDVVYASGFWMGASAHGLPDVGILTYTQMLDRVSTLAKTMPRSAVIADADTGYGGLLNVRETVRGYEEAGIQVVQIEDQEFPKKCGHTPNKRIVPINEMVAKIKVAKEACTKPETLIAARTDALQSEGYEGVLRRAEAFAEAGADIIFPEAMETEQQMREICTAIDRPLMINMADGATEILSASKLKDMGFAIAIFPGTASLAAAQAVHGALSHLKEHGTSISPNVELYDFQAFCRNIGFEEIWAFDRRWADEQDA